MNRLNRLLTFSTVVLLTTSVTQAQTTKKEPPPPEQLAEMRTDAYTKALGLTDEQAASFMAIFLEGERDAAELRAACFEAQQKVMSMMRERDLIAEKELTKEQFQKLQALKSDGSFNADMSCCSGPACCKGSSKGDAVPKAVIKEGKVERVPLQNTYPELKAPN